MSTNWVKDIEVMHQHYKAKDHVKTLSKKQLENFLNFRIRFIDEELTELSEAYNSADDTVDALIDICVVAIGTLQLFDVDANLAWDRVLTANMSKTVGVKATRPNPLGFPDLIKPPGWIAPSHTDNIGCLPVLICPAEL